MLFFLSSLLVNEIDIVWKILFVSYFVKVKKLLNLLLYEIEFWMTNRFESIIGCCILIINPYFFDQMDIYYIFFNVFFLYSSTEFRCTWFESVEHNGCFRTSTTRHRSLHRTLLDFIGKWCTQFREFTLWIQLNTGFDWSLRKMLVSVCICRNEISSIYSMINDLIFFSLSFIWN